MPGAGLKAKVAAILKASTKTDHQTSASKLVESAIQDVAPLPNEILRNLELLTRIVNRVRENYRPISNLYVLNQALHKEALQLNYQISLVCQRKLYRRRRKESEMAEAVI